MQEIIVFGMLNFSKTATIVSEETISSYDDYYLSASNLVNIIGPKVFNAF